MELNDFELPLVKNSAEQSMQIWTIYELWKFRTRHNANGKQKGRGGIFTASLSAVKKRDPISEVAFL